MRSDIRAPVALLDEMFDHDGDSDILLVLLGDVSLSGVEARAAR